MEVDLAAPALPPGVYSLDLQLRVRAKFEAVLLQRSLKQVPLAKLILARLPPKLLKKWDANSLIYCVLRSDGEKWNPFTLERAEKMMEVLSNL